jgi:hypothetical protein
MLEMGRATTWRSLATLLASNANLFVGLDMRAAAGRGRWIRAELGHSPSQQVANKKPPVG